MLAASTLVLLVGCARSGNEEASRAVLAAVETTIETGSLAFDQLATFEDTAGVPDGTRLHDTGSSALLGGDRVLHVVESGSAEGTVELIVDGSTAYVRGDPVARLTGDRSMWLLVDLDSNDPVSEQLQTLASGEKDASILLYYLFGVAARAEVVGSETVEGVKTTRYRTSVELGKAVDEAPFEAQDALRDNLVSIMGQDMPTTLDAEVWIDEEGLVRRVSYVFDLADSVGGGHLLVTTDFSEFGDHAEVDLPSPDQVVTVADLTE
jgi:hypothetical protein